MEFPGSEISCHMSMFPPRTYKKAHRHGPGRAIVIPGGRGLLGDVGRGQRQGRRAVEARAA